MDAPSSFSKSLFFGHIPETLVIPYPRVSADEKESIRLVLESFHKFAEAEIDAKKIDDEAKIPPDLLQKLKALGLFGLQIPESHGGLGLSATGYARVVQDIAGVEADFLNPFYYARPATIYGGSSEIQRNILAKYVLKLPG